MSFDPALAERLASLALPAYFYDSFEPWAKAEGYCYAKAFHEGSLQAKLLDDGERLILVFAGTDLLNLREWAQYDFDLRRQPMLGGWVHKGFWKAIHARNRDSSQDLFKQIITALANRFAENGKRRVIICGHSLGAAMTKLFAAEIANAAAAGQPLLVTPEDIAALYTTGEPRSGNATYAAAMERHYEGKMHRGVFNRDWVPQMPLRKLGYAHSGEPHFIEADGTLLPTTERIYYRTASSDHLPQRYMRAYSNAQRRENGEPLIPIGRTFKQTMRDFYVVAFHPGRGKNA